MNSAFVLLAAYHGAMAFHSPKRLKRASGIRLRLGGEEPTGWLPPGAARPLPTPVREVLVDIELQGDGANGCLLIFQAQDESFCWDNWYESIQAAELAAQVYGVEPSDWITIDWSSNGPTTKKSATECRGPDKPAGE